MKKTIPLLIITFLLFGNCLFAQNYFRQYFDGADTNSYNSMIIKMDTASQNIWQIGKPHKAIFDSAFSRPHVLVTDTSLAYPINDTSIFYINIPLSNFYYSHNFALQWAQKLDMDSAHDGAIIEFATDTVSTWQNIFTSPMVYNVFGYRQANKMVLPSGEAAFSGTDSAWTDIWACVQWDWNQPPVDTLRFKFTFISDSVNTAREGWMIDNMSGHGTIIHPITEVNSDEHLKVFPRLTAGNITVQPKSKSEEFAIKNADLIDASGRVVQHYNMSAAGAQIDISNHASGWYILRVQTTTIEKSYSIWLNKK